MKWTFEIKKPKIRRGFLAENRYYLVIGVFTNPVNGRLMYEEEVLIWDRVKLPTRRTFIGFIKEIHDDICLFTALSCVSEFKSKEEAEAYQRELGKDLVKTIEQYDDEMLESNFQDALADQYHEEQNNKLK